MPTLLKLHDVNGNLFYANWDTIAMIIPTDGDQDAPHTEIQFIDAEELLTVKESAVEIIAQILRG